MQISDCKEQLGLKLSEVQKRIENQSDELDNLRRQLEQSRREEHSGRLWVQGIVLGVFGNMLVSASVEITKTSGFEQSLWSIVLMLSWIFFMGAFRTSADLLHLPTGRIRMLTYAFLVFMLVWAFVVILVLPLLTQ